MKDDSSFEILTSSEEEEYSTSSSLWSSTLKGSFFESMSSSLSPQRRIEGAEDNNCAVPINFDNLTPRLQLQTESFGNSDFNIRRSQDTENALIQSAEDAISFDAKSEIHSDITLKNLVAEVAERGSPEFQIIGETTRQYQPIENFEDYLKGESFGNPQLTTVNEIVVIEEPRSQPRTDTPLSFQEFDSNVNALPLDRRSENVVVQMHPDRKNSPKNLCSAMKCGLQMCSWFRNNKCVQNFVAGAKSSFHSFMNTFELEMNLMLGMENPLRILIIADTMDSVAIEDAFYELFSGQVVITKCQVGNDHTIIPILPIGYNSALQVVQFKINNAREVLHDSEMVVIVSTANFIAEIVPQRWQMSTVLCLEDPNLQLNLHNFTSTIPVPNEYIYHAQRLTPEDYPLRGRGLSVTLEEAIGYIVGNDSKDTQEFLSGIDIFASLKSAADILAGMYKKYANRSA